MVTRKKRKRKRFESSLLLLRRKQLRSLRFPLQHPKAPNKGRKKVGVHSESLYDKIDGPHILRDKGPEDYMMVREMIN